MEQPQQPKVSDFHKASEYLEAYYRYRKALNPRFSFEVWVRQLDLKSKSYLRSVMKGLRPPGMECRSRLLATLPLNAVEKHLLLKLFQLEWSKTASQKSALLKELRLLTKKCEHVARISDPVEFLSLPANPMLLTLLSFEDIDRDIETLCRLTGQKRTLIEKSLLILEKLGLAERFFVRNSPQWRAIQSSFRLTSVPGNMIFQRYYEQLLVDTAKTVMEPKSEPIPYLKSCWVALSPKERKDLAQDISAFIEERISHYDTDLLRGKVLYQINLQVISATK